MKKSITILVMLIFGLAGVLFSLICVWLFWSAIWEIILFSWHHGLRWLIAAAIVWMVGMEIYERLTRKSRIKKDLGPIPAPPAYPPLVQRMMDDLEKPEK